MWGDDIEAAIKAADERQQGRPDDPQLAAIWRDERDGRAYCPGDPILAEALDATRHLPEGGTPEPDPEPVWAAEKPEPVGGGDPFFERRAMAAADERNSWLATGRYKESDTLRVREYGGEHG